MQSPTASIAYMYALSLLPQDPQMSPSPQPSDIRSHIIWSQKNTSPWEENSKDSHGRKKIHADQEAASENGTREEPNANAVVEVLSEYRRPTVMISRLAKDIQVDDVHA